MTPRQAEERVRGFLDDWKPWVAIAYFALVALVVWLFFLNQSLAKEQAARSATAKANAVSSRDNCYRMVDNNPDLVAIIDAVSTNAQNSIISARAILKVDPDGPLSSIRRASIRRAQAAVAAAGKFHNQIIKTTPTEERCDALAERLGLSPRQEGQ